MSKTGQFFAKAATSYVDQARVQELISAQLLDELGQTYGLWLDIGCGPKVQPLGDHSIGIDLAHFQGHTSVQACTEAIPLANDSVNGIYSNMALQWCRQPLNAIEEWYRVCKLGAKVACSMTSDGNFAELMQAYHSLGLPCPVQPTLPATAWLSLFDSKFERIRHHNHEFTLYFSDITSLIKHIKRTGANEPAQSSGIKTASSLRALEAAYPRDNQGMLPLTYKATSLIAQKSYVK